MTVRIGFSASKAVADLCVFLIGALWLAGALGGSAGPA